MITYGISLEHKVEDPFPLVQILPPSLSACYRTYLEDNDLVHSRRAFKQFLEDFQDEDNHTGIGALLAACIQEEDGLCLYGDRDYLVLPLECPWDYPEPVRTIGRSAFQSLIRQWAGYVTDEPLDFLFFTITE